MRTSMIGVFQFLNTVNVLHSEDAIMGRKREEKDLGSSLAAACRSLLTKNQTNKPQNPPSQSTHATQAVLSHLH